ncbi:MAG TPA: adenosylcobinamide-phosphate synthase CbiB [Polyangiales bacterium]|nr:adenosylcobinamide-phosphate synthase CbiB [Polyangiales bacterium]
MSFALFSSDLSLLVYASGCVADLFVRIPDALHPVAWYGRAAASVVRIAPTVGSARAFAAGVFIALGLPAAAVGIVHGALVLTQPWPVVSVLLQVLILYSCVCLFGLLEAARTLVRTLREQGLEAARPRLRWLCSRDPAELDANGLANGTVESLAENLSDSVVAPLFFLVCFGVEGAVAYRAINTLDAMIGYRGKYEWLGKPAARLDDLANVVPARLTTLLLAAAGLSLRGVSLARGFAVWSRDHARTASPNAGHPMAMAAGLLGVKLDKPGHYALGDGLPAATPEDIPRAISLGRRAGLLALSFAAVAVYWFGLDGVYG